MSLIESMPGRFEIEGTEFGLLTLGDFATIQKQYIEIPEVERCQLTLLDVMRWCATPQGALATLLVARKKIDKKATWKQIEALGMPLKLCMAAADLVAKSAGLDELEEEDGDPLDASQQTQAKPETPQPVGTGS